MNMSVFVDGLDKTIELVEKIEVLNGDVKVSDRVAQFRMHADRLLLWDETTDEGRVQIYSGLIAIAANALDLMQKIAVPPPPANVGPAPEAPIEEEAYPLSREDQPNTGDHA